VDAESGRVPLSNTDDIELDVETSPGRTVDKASILGVAILVKFESRLVEVRDDNGMGITVMVVASDVEFVIDGPSMDPKMVGVVLADEGLAGIGDTVIV